MPTPSPGTDGSSGLVSGNRLRADAVFLGGLAFFGAAVQCLGPDDWQRPSPCAEWRALDVVGHAGAVARFATEQAQGRNPACDLMRSTGATVELPDDIIDFAHEVIDPMPDTVVRNAQALGPPIAVPATATRSQTFIAWTGRPSLTAEIR
jgi:hypothetical protein